MGIDSGVIDILIVGDDINKNYLDNIQPKVEKKINRKINFMISSTGTSQKGLILFEVIKYNEVLIKIRDKQIGIVLAKL